ncbi:AEC family transporter [Pontibacter sp. G13]|uniref:AEC family transporter n=1 Tax=Pontibacter sp. G13 TaxID=3074898 RepID=UPI00288A4DB8|nr:AEC family transporter [Pontibacter sp. G13]WNJ19950.1 AEC family transporter [Pontibacter sp. G13]
MDQFFLLIFCLGAGILLQRIPGFPKDAHRGINGFLIYLSLPAITLRFISTLQFDWSHTYPIAMGWLVFLGALIFFPLVGRLFGWDQRTIGCLILCCGFSNTSFVGFPILENFYGEAGLSIGVLCDQPGTFLPLSTFGIAIASYFSSKSGRVRDWLLKPFTFPPFLAFLLGVVINLCGWAIPQTFMPTLEIIGNTMTPLALVAVGLQLKITKGTASPWPFGMGLVYKLFLAPLLIMGLYVGIIGLEGLSANVSIIESAMPPMVVASIIAIEYDLNPRLASLLVGIGIPISLLTVYSWYLLI